MNNPKYYKRFSCVAGKCTDSCCDAGWEITIDDKTFDRYSRLKGEIGEKFRDNIAIGEDGDRIFKLDENGRCPFHNDKGLCELYKASHGRMTEICKNYPRYFEEFDGFTEAGISISCPEAQRLILSAKQKDYDLGREKTDDELLSDYLFLRKQAFESVGGRFSAEWVLLDIMLKAHAAQIGYDIGEYIGADAPNVVKSYDPEEVINRLCDVILSTTDILNPKWRDALQKGASQLKTVLDSEKKNYLRYLIYRYYLKAINREDLLSQVQLIATLYMLPLMLEGDYHELIRLAAKEIEHNSENMYRVLEALDDCRLTNPAMIEGAVRAVGDAHYKKR